MDMQQLHKNATCLKIVCLLLFLLPALLLSGCSKTDFELSDGYFMAQAASYDEYGWKEYVVIYVKDNRIVTVNYNAKNPSGFIKSWDMQYMRDMNEICGTYPNEYTRVYAEALVNNQSVDAVDVISGATSSYHTFKKLAEAAIAQAKNGDKNLAIVDVSES